MANQEHLALLRLGVEQWNLWRKQHPEIEPDLRNAELMAADLKGADLDNADLLGADLSMADLRGASFHSALLYFAYLNSAHLNFAHLNSTDLRGADLNFADLSGAELGGANFSYAKLRFARLNGIHTQNTTFANVDLSETKGLAEIQHEGPSSIQLYAVRLPLDGSALHFLRGAGVPDEWIDLYRTQMLSPIQYHSVFISYSSQDDLLARRLHADLQDQGVRCWFAPEDMKIGDKIRARIDEAIHLQDKLLLLLSEHSLASVWVEDEVEAALEKEQRQQREVLFPVRLDESAMHTTQAWAAKLRRTRHIGDFTNWTEPQAYQQAFDRLLRDLKANAE